MALFPRKVKYRKWQKGRRNPAKRSLASRGNVLSFGSFGIKTEVPGAISVNQIEAARRVIVRSLGKTGKVWIRIFADRPVTRKPAEVGMGHGKGDPVGFVAPVKTGSVLFEVDGVDQGVARDALRKAGARLPVKTRFVTRT